MSGLGGAVKLVVKTFLDNKHYRDLHRILSDQWADCHSLTAAVRLMEGHGVRLTPQEEAKLAGLSEDRMIDALVMKMPQQSREQFEHFFLQLSLIASTTTRLRAALESGNAELIEEVLDSAEKVGILTYILKMAVAQAGSEVKLHLKQHEEWMAATEGKMGPLLQGQAQASIAQKALNQAKAELGMSRVTANEKSKKVLLRLIEGQSGALIGTTFSLWTDDIAVAKKEREIRKDYEQEIANAEARLKAYIEKSVGIMKNVINKKHGEGFMYLVQECFNAMKAEVDENKFAQENKEAIDQLNSELAKFSADKKAAARKSLGGMAANQDLALQTVVFQAWVAFSQDYKKNKDIEDAVKEKERQVQDMMKKQKEGSKSVLDRMAQGADTALIQTCMQSWIEWYVEQKKANEMQDMLESGSGRFNEFSKRNKGSAGNLMDRTAFLTEQGTQIVVFMYWKKDTKVERMRRWAKEKNDKKKKQLIGVKGLFKNFATELEQGLKDGTPRVDQSKKSRSRSSGAPSPQSGGAPA